MRKLNKTQSDNKLRKQINKAAETYLCDQEEGDLYDAYNKLLEQSDKGNDDCTAANYVTVWQPLENITVAKMIQLIEDGIEEPEMPEFVQKIDWELLRKQKGTLMNLAKDIDDVPKLEHLEGIIVLIDALQDSAVDDYGIAEDLVFDLTEDEEEL